MDKRDRSIQLLRIVAMLMITMDHILINIDIPMKSTIIQVANSGVFIFLLISGILYGRKKIDNWKRWYINRIIKICLPMWIFMIVVFIYRGIVFENVHVAEIIIHFFNIQGFIQINNMMIHLWFLTLLMICYFITPLLQLIKKKQPKSRSYILGCIILIVLQIILAYTTDIGLVAGHTASWCVIAIGVYMLGYFYGDRIINKNLSARNIVIYSLFVAFTAIVVILCRKYFDGIIFYDRILIFSGMLVVDIWIGLIMCKLSNVITKQWQIRILDYLDKISYEVYIVHGFVIVAITIRLLKEYGVVAYILSTILFTWLIAHLLNLISNKLQKLIHN